MAIIIVKSVYSMKNGRTKLYVWAWNGVGQNTITQNVKAEENKSLKYDWEYDIYLYFEYILNLEGHTLKNSFISDFRLYFALATGTIATIQSINQL